MNFEHFACVGESESTPIDVQDWMEAHRIERRGTNSAPTPLFSSEPGPERGSRAALRALEPDEGRMSDVAVRKKSNGRWEVRWRDGAGRRRGRTVNLKKDADKLATEIRRQQQIGDFVDLERGSVILADFVLVYWRDYAIPNLAPRTRAVYGLAWEKHLRPRIGAFPLRELTTPLLTRLRAELARDGVGDPTVLKAFTMLQSVLSDAVVEGHVDHNAARGSEAPPARGPARSTRSRQRWSKRSGATSSRETITPRRSWCA